MKKKRWGIICLSILIVALAAVGGCSGSSDGDSGSESPPAAINGSNWGAMTWDRDNWE